MARMKCIATPSPKWNWVEADKKSPAPEARGARHDATGRMDLRADLRKSGDQCVRLRFFIFFCGVAESVDTAGCSVAGAAAVVAGVPEAGCIGASVSFFMAAGASACVVCGVTVVGGGVDGPACCAMAAGCAATSNTDTKPAERVQKILRFCIIIMLLMALVQPKPHGLGIADMGRVPSQNASRI